MGFFTRIKIFFDGLFRWFKGIVEKVFTTGLKKFLRAAWDFGEKVVKSLENVDLSTNKKREDAFNKIKDMAETEGLYYKNNWINILIELVLQAIRAEGEF